MLQRHILGNNLYDIILQPHLIHDLPRISHGIKISAPEEIAFKYGWIDRETLLESASRYGKSPYGQHLKNVADGKLRY